MRHTARAKLREIRAALRLYHHALDTHQHGGVAAGHFVDRVQEILKTPWVQGATLTDQQQNQDQQCG